MGHDPTILIAKGPPKAGAWARKVIVRTDILVLVLEKLQEHLWNLRSARK